MGKDRQQRVKGNAQPSASSKAAELLGNAAAPVFIGFSAFSGASGSDGLPGDLSVIVRKLDKRDEVTKQRACDELNDLLERQPDYISSLLPFWPALYSRLSIDADRRIRLGVNQAHAKICQNVGKNIAPRLKELLGPWLNSIYDPLREISSCALATFNATFPEPKRKGVLVFGLAEVIQYIYDNIIIKKPETLSDPRYATSEDMASKYSRVVAGCLLTLSYLLETAEKDAINADIDSKIKEILNSDIFWSLLKHSDTNIRKSMYQALQTLAAKTEYLLEHKIELQKLFLLSAFTDKEAATHQNFWDAILTISKRIPNVWSVDSKQAKTIANNFLKFLQSAFYGSATTSYPSIVVMMSCFPESVLTEFETIKYFDAFFSGLSSDTIDITRSEALIVAYFESLIFWTKKAGDAEGTFKYGFEKIFDLYLFAYENRALQEKLNEFKFRTIIVDNLVKFYSKRLLSGHILDTLVFARINDAVKSSVMLTFDRYFLIMRRVALLYEYAFSRIDIKYLDELISTCTNLLRDGFGLKGNLHLLAALPEKYLHGIISESPLVSKILSHLTGEDFEIFCKVLIKNSKNVSNDAYGQYWDDLINSMIAETDKYDELLAKLFQELRTDTHAQYLIENRQLQDRITRLESTRLYHLVKYVLFLPNLVSDESIPSIFDKLISCIGDLEESLLNMLTSEISKSKYLEHSQNFDLLAKIGMELIKNLSIMDLNDEIETEEYSRLRACYEAFCAVAKSSDALKNSLTLIHRSCKVEVGVFARNAKLIYEDILLNENIRKSTLHLLNSDDETWAKSSQVETDAAWFLSLLDPLVEKSEVFSDVNESFDEFGMKPLARLFACVSEFVQIYGTERFVAEIVVMDREDDSFLEFLSSYLVSCQKISDLLQIGSNIMWTESLDETFARYRNACFNFVEGLVAINTAYNIEKFLKDATDDSIVSMMVKRLLSTHQVRAARIIVHAVKAHAVDVDISKIQQISMNHLKLETIQSYLTFSDRLKLNQQLLKTKDQLSVSIVLGSRSGVRIEKVPFESDAPIPLLDAHALIDEIFDRGIDEFNLRVVESFTHYPSLLENHHWQCIIDKCKKTLVDIPNQKINFVEYCWYLLLYLRILVAKDHSLISEELHDDIDDLNATASMCVFNCFVNLEYSIVKGKILTFYENLISALIAYIPIEVIRREWDYSQLLVPIGKRNQEIQKAAYKLLHDLTIELVSEMSAALDLIEYDSDNIDNQARLPDVILATIEKGLADISMDDTEWKTRALRYLLTSMILLDHFEHANMSLKSQYVAHLNEKGILAGMLINLTRILGLGSSERKPLDLSKWELRYIEILELDLSATASIPLLAAHVYWRILRNIPSGVRTWFLECNNRQLNLAVEAYTEKFFGPLLIDDELEEVKNMGSDFFGESMTIRINRGSTSSEVVASYRVDETSLEMAIRLPSCYPLKQVEIDGLQRVGVSEERWRRWMLTCNATMTSQNGSIKDALTTFKQNAEKHFEGIEDCAICYSVIGTLDRSLPTKQCKTCKNKFHPACLYKWFKTSNNSSCPLCRSLF